MSLDFDAIRKKLERLSGNNRNKSLMWRPVEGEAAHSSSTFFC